MTVNPTLTDDDIDSLIGLLMRLRGPGVVDPALPPDPDNERYPEGIRDWANDQVAELDEERRRRKRNPNAGTATIILDDE